MGVAVVVVESGAAVVEVGLWVVDGDVVLVGGSVVASCVKATLEAIWLFPGVPELPGTWCNVVDVDGVVEVVVGLVVVGLVVVVALVVVGEVVVLDVEVVVVVESLSEFVLTVASLVALELELVWPAFPRMATEKVAPFQVKASPWLFTTTQCAAEAQDTAVNLPMPPNPSLPFFWSTSLSLSGSFALTGSS